MSRELVRFAAFCIGLELAILTVTALYLESQPPTLAVLPVSPAMVLADPLPMIVPLLEWSR